MDYAELSLNMAAAHQRADELALKKDWAGAKVAVMVARAWAYQLEDWFENAAGSGK